jgi:uncharacterized membrane protein
MPFFIPPILAFNPSLLQQRSLSDRTPGIQFQHTRSLFQHQKKTTLHALTIDSSDQILSLWVLAFASSHIGMSAIRTQLISSIGDATKSLDLVGNVEWKLPSWWPGDNTGGNCIFPDGLTAGRQIYRAFYTAISFITLGSAFLAYISSSVIHGNIPSEESPIYYACLLTGSLSFGAAIASLFNASPLGLMPSFEGSSSDTDATIAGIRRDDTLKFTTRGLTRITRHPLILPVVPWGVATAYLAGGRLCDYIFFGGLSLYAIAGCFAQDLRVIREEGSVGTVFQTESRQRESDERARLRRFFAETSFVPFKAVLDGRQSLDDVVRELPWLPFIVGTYIGMIAEIQILEMLQNWIA